MCKWSLLLDGTADLVTYTTTARTRLPWYTTYHHTTTAALPHHFAGAPLPRRYPHRTQRACLARAPAACPPATTCPPPTTTTWHHPRCPHHPLPPSCCHTPATRLPAIYTPALPPAAPAAAWRRPALPATTCTYLAAPWCLAVRPPLLICSVLPCACCYCSPTSASNKRYAYVTRRSASYTTSPHISFSAVNGRGLIPGSPPYHSPSRQDDVRRLCVVG